MALFLTRWHWPLPGGATLVNDSAPDPYLLTAPLRKPGTIRARCRNILQAVSAGQSRHFRLDLQQLDAVAERIEHTTRQNYPDLQIPYHSRWRHFESGGIKRKQLLDQALAGAGLRDQARAQIDLTLISVLLDAGAGPQWSYLEPGSSQCFSRSEGLGVASFQAFLQGIFSADPDSPCRVDGQRLLQISAADLALVFQVDTHNPLVGLEGRANLLQRLGQTLLANPRVFGPDGRPAGLLDHLTDQGRRQTLAAAEVLQALLDHLGPIWLTSSRLHGVPLGDCWPHPLAGGEGASAGWVPFHKLSQWLTYSLLEPLQWAGIQLTDLDDLTGLPEYRNGGLLLDAGVIIPRDPAFATGVYRAADEAIIEWRALTVALLDVLAPRVRERLGRSQAELPLACILEGGSWAAGRGIARELREGGPPPLQIESDGTVF